MRRALFAPFPKGISLCEFSVLSFLPPVVNDFCVVGSIAVARHPEYDYHQGFCFKEAGKQRVEFKPLLRTEREY